MVLYAKDILNFLNIRGTPAHIVCQQPDLNLRPFKLKGFSSSHYMFQLQLGCLYFP